MDLAIASVPVFVDDQERALEFYRDKLGFEITLDAPVGPGLRWLTMAPYNGATELILFHPAMAGPEQDAVRQRVGTWTGIVLLTENCRAHYQELLALGVPFSSAPKQPFWGGWTAEFSDPDGNRFQLVERPGYLLRAVKTADDAENNAPP
jgi:lactoylglutathione lyase